MAGKKRRRPAKAAKRGGRKAAQRPERRPEAEPPGQTREIDLARITELRRIGLDTLADIARAMGVPKQTLANPQHAIEVKEAIERGRVLAKKQALEQYEAAIASKNGNLAALLIFKMKQFDWTDRARIDATLEAPEGVREIVEETIAKLRAKDAAEAGA